MELTYWTLSCPILELWPNRSMVSVLVDGVEFGGFRGAWRSYFRYESSWYPELRCVCSRFLGGYYCLGYRGLNYMFG